MEISEQLELVTSKLKVSLSADLARLDTRLAVIETEARASHEQSKAVVDQLRQMNGSVRSLVEWRAAKEAQCEAHIGKTEVLSQDLEEKSREYDTQIRGLIEARGEITGSRRTMLALGGLVGAPIGVAITKIVEHFMK